MESFTFSSLALLFLLTSGELFTCGKPSFRENGEPTGKVAFEGESCQFECSLVGLRPTVDYLVRWEYSTTVIGPAQADNIIYTNEKYNVLTNLNDYGSKLVVNNITFNDQGYYRCWLYEDNNATLGSRSGFLEVILRPLFRDMPTDQTVVEGKNVTLRCSFENFATGDLYISWFLNRKNISRNYFINQSSVPQYLEGLRIDNAEGSGVFDLHINRVGRKGNGMFQCQCKAYVDDCQRSILKSRVAKITVIYPPANEFPKCNPSMLQDYYKEGEVLETSCWAMGGNAPVYFYWHKNGEIKNGTAVNNVQLVTAEWTLTEADDGKYVHCSMKGPAILQARQCSIGPIKVQTSTKSSFTLMYDFETTVAATSESRNVLIFTTYFLQSKATLPTSTLSPGTQSSVSELLSVGHARTIPYVYIIIFLLVVFISAVIVIAVFIVRKKCGKEPSNVDEMDNANSDLTHYEEARSLRHASDELSLQPESSVEKIELPLNKSSLEPMTNDNLAIGTADVTYAQVCKVKRPKTKKDMGEEKKSRNVEGLIYADLDLHQNEDRDLAFAMPSLRDDSSVTYAELQISRPSSTKNE